MIKVHFTDFWEGFNPKNNFIIRVLQRIDSVFLDRNTPDFLFYSNFGTKYTNFDCVRIYYSGENCSPDFNWCDYAIGFDFIEFGDRYFRFPLFFFDIEEDLGRGLAPYEAEEVYSRKKFCSFLYSNSTYAHPIREQLFQALNTYRHVDAGGTCCNTLGYRIKDHKEWQKTYRFTIACENSEKPGYVTEKLADALIANTIPIYWGNPSIALDVNPARIIHVRDYPNLTSLIKKIQKIDTNKEEFCRVVSQPWFIGKHPITPESDVAFATFLHSIVKRSPEEARRIPRYGYSRQLQEQHCAHLRGWEKYKMCTNWLKFFCR